MKTTRTLALRRDVLTELTDTDLRDVNGAAFTEVSCFGSCYTYVSCWAADCLPSFRDPSCICLES